MPDLRRGAPALVVLTAAAVLLAGCAPTAAPAPVPSAVLTGGAPASAAPTAAPVALDLSKNAAANQAYFDQVNQAFVASGHSLDGRSLIDDLVGAGFPKDAMEVTPDKTPGGNNVDTIEFAVRLNGTCLIGQWGSGTGYSSTTTTMLGGSHCLVGTTRTIDW